MKEGGEREGGREEGGGWEVGVGEEGREGEFTTPRHDFLQSLTAVSVDIHNFVHSQFDFAHFHVSPMPGTMVSYTRTQTRKGGLLGGGRLEYMYFTLRLLASLL